MLRTSLLFLGIHKSPSSTRLTHGMASPRRYNVGRRSKHTNDGHDARGLQLQPPHSKPEKGRTRPRHWRNIQIPSTSKLFRLFLLGFGDAGRAWEYGMFGRICRGAMEVFQEED